MMSKIKWVAVLLVAASGCGVPDQIFCDVPGCDFDQAAWARLKSLAGLGAAPADPSNKYALLPEAATLGQKLYFDERFSGDVTMLDSLRRPVPYARAPKGQPAGISCATCHDPRRAGADFTSNPNRVSIGAGWYDVNSQQTVNAAHYRIIYWNGRNDSLWSQIVAVSESFVSMGSNRLKIVWLMKNKYEGEFNAVFAEHSLGFMPALSALRVEPSTLPDGSANPRAEQCQLDNGACPSGCFERESAVTDGGTLCWPRFPLQGRPGGTAGCQAGAPSEPFKDAFDCMEAADRTSITRAYVNYSKAIAAYEQQLISVDSRFDQFMTEGPRSPVLSATEKRGARLFVGKASCIDCHNTPLFSDSNFHNVGSPWSGDPVPTESECAAGTPCDCVAGNNCLPWGGYDGLKKLKNNNFRRTSMWSDDPTDISRQAYVDMPLTDTLKGTWRTPSLRDVALTAPYMHDGSYPTLESVVSAYNKGGASSGFSGAKSVRIRPLRLTQDEESDLVAFLNTLTGAPLPAELTHAPELPK